jgi:hypothetical protein
VLHGADRLAERRVLVAREVEEAQEIAVSQVEEEVAGTGVVAVLDQFHQGEAEELLVEPDGLLHVAADQRGVVDAARGGRGPLGRRTEVALPDLVAAVPYGGQFLTLRLWHPRPPSRC